MKETIDYYVAPKRKGLPDEVMGILFLIGAEIMFFAGLISAYIVGRSGMMDWPPVGQPRLPIEITAVNTVVLLASGYAAWLFFKRQMAQPVKSLLLLLLAIGLGLTFLIVQGSEWIRLVSFGLAAKSNLYGAFFYTIIGAHAAHAVAGLILLIYLYFFLRRKTDHTRAKNKTEAFLLFWYFVVGIWPILYYLVYLL